MAEEMKKIDNKELEKVDGGMATAYAALKEDLKEMIPAEVREKLRASRGSNVETCRILAQNGIDVEKIEKKIKDAGINLNKIAFKEIPVEELEKVAGGSAKVYVPLVCRCGNADINKMSYQIFDSICAFLDYDCDYESAYRCELCNTYILRLRTGYLAYE